MVLQVTLRGTMDLRLRALDYYTGPNVQDRIPSGSVAADLAVRYRGGTTMLRFKAEFASHDHFLSPLPSELKNGTERGFTQPGPSE
jgi:hypothetical protein